MTYTTKNLEHLRTNYKFDYWIRLVSCKMEALMANMNYKLGLYEPKYGFSWNSNRDLNLPTENMYFMGS